MRMHSWRPIASLLVAATAAWLSLACGSVQASKAVSLGSCGEAGWARTAEGRPSGLATQRAGYFLWYDGGGWHLRALANRVSLIGAVTASARLQVGNPPPARTGGRVVVRPKSISFRFDAHVPGAIDFTVGCAARLSFSFAAKNGPSPTVHLGAQGLAPASLFALRRPATSGVEGQILAGPTCPVVGIGGNCGDKPTKGTVRIETAQQSKSGQTGGKLVGTVESDSKGRFARGLPAGRYSLTVVKSSSDHFVAKPTSITVDSGVVTRVTAVVDTGIR
jgi:hypothetical protein